MRDLDPALTYRTIGAATEVHKHLKPGLLESAYLRCLARELSLLGIPYEREVPIDIMYKGERVETVYRLDLLVEKRLILEVKSVAALTPLHDAQLLTYLRATGLRVGLLLNFNVLSMREGIRRLVLWTAGVAGTAWHRVSQRNGLHRVSQNAAGNQLVAVLCETRKRSCLCNSVPRCFPALLLFGRGHPLKPQAVEGAP